jgi:hypothetical protein
MHVMSIIISLLLNTKRLDFYSTADRYAVFIGLRPPVSSMASDPSRVF